MVNNNQHKRASKFLSLVLRHKPETIGLVLDINGWADTNELIEKFSNHDLKLTIDELKLIVENNDKKRFVLSEDFSRIRANQGHSVEVDLQLKEAAPPDELYHGTAAKNIETIKIQGLLKGSRHHVHLSTDIETARKVGMRYGKPVILIVDAKQMNKDGYKFFFSENAVWLTEFVLPKYIRL